MTPNVTINRRQYEITRDGIVIGEPVREYEGLLSGRPTRTPAAPLEPGPKP